MQDWADEETFYQNNGLLRPALLEKMAVKMKAQHEKTIWPEGWCQWKTEEEIKQMHPGITCIDGGLWLPIGLSVDVGGYLQVYARFLQDSGVRIWTGQRPIINRAHNEWHISIDGTTIRARHLLFAIGRATTESRYWDWLPLHLIKGQVATFSTGDEPLPFSQIGRAHV